MPTAPDLPIPMRALLAGARRKEPALLDLTRQLVPAESPSGDKAAVDACVALAAAQAKALGGRVKLHRQLAFGDLLEARFGPKSQSGVTVPTTIEARSAAFFFSAIWIRFGRGARSRPCPAGWLKAGCGGPARWT